MTIQPDRDLRQDFPRPPRGLLGPTDRNWEAIENPAGIADNPLKTLKTAKGKFGLAWRFGPISLALFGDLQGRFGEIVGGLGEQRLA